MRAGDVIELSVERIDLDAAGLARAGTTTVSVPALFAGERARVRIEHVSKASPRAHGRVLERVSSLPARRAAPCPQHPDNGGKCNGCGLMALEDEAQREQKRGMLAGLGLEVGALIAPGPSLGYRFSSKRVVFGRPGSVRLGSYERGTHTGADMRGCLVEHPRIAAAADELADQATRLGIEPYDEKRHEGDLRYVWLKTDGRRVLVTLVTRTEDSRAARELPSVLRLADGVAHSVHRDADNALRGTAARVLSGAGSLTVELAGVATDVLPLGFLQPNPRAIEHAYRLLAGAPPGRLALDLYAGSGTTTALLRERFERVVACESYPESARALGVEPEPVERFLERWRERPDLAVANPPRKGLGEAVCAGLIVLAAPRLHVMSCGPEGLARDLARLCAGGYRVERLVAVDALPQTPHVELVALLVRGSPSTD